jgi:anthranilate phosphoribosyltransferase
MSKHLDALISQDEPAIVSGIKSVGIGKKGSKPLSPDLAGRINEDIKANHVSDVQKGAFIGALITKGLTEDERIIEEAFPVDLHDSLKLCQFLAPKTSLKIQKISADLLEGKELDSPTAYSLGKFLFSNEPGDALRGLTASILRVRYETAEEYEALLKSIEETIEPAFLGLVPAGQPIIQIAEPFDGVDHSNMITPLLADYLRQKKYRVVSLVGRNGGPKLEMNLCDLAKEIGGVFLKNNAECNDSVPPFGYFLNQTDVSKSLDHWVDLRRQIIKRPFLSTLERFINPLHTDILIASAFHPPYGEKMLTICERAGFPGAVIIRNGMEGTIAFPLKRSVKILCSRRKEDGSYERYEFEFNSEEFLKESVEIEEKLSSISAEANARLIKDYIQKQTSGNRLFDLRIKATCAGIQQALQWIDFTKGTV